MYASRKVKSQIKNTVF